MEEYVRKLALWHTKTFRPMMNHDELEPIMSTLGFIPLPPTTTTAWREYVFCGVGVSDHHHHHQQYHQTRTASVEKSEEEEETEEEEPPLSLPTPRLPYPRIDGLHIYTYRAFCDAVAFYIGERVLPDHFHVRGMPLHRMYDRPFEKKFRVMNDEDIFYVYRDGTLDPATKAFYIKNNNSTAASNTGINDCVIKRGNNNIYSHRRNKNVILHNNTGNINVGSLVSLKDIIVL